MVVKRLNKYLLIFSLLFFYTSPSWSCTCFSRMTPEVAYSKSQRVLIANVTQVSEGSVVIPGLDGVLREAPSKKYSLFVSKYLKGLSSENIIDVYSSLNSCTKDLEVGFSYIFYLKNPGNSNEKDVISVCSRIIPLDESDADQKFISTINEEKPL